MEEQNTAIITRFYDAFQNKDYVQMNICYSDDIVFSDPVFGILRGYEVKCMWEMLCKNAQNFSVSYNNITLIDEEYATCNWKAAYTFTATGNNVVNNVKAFMKIVDGKITEHSDAFRLSIWMGQALGWKGKLFGWMGFLQRAVQKKARHNLENFIQSKLLAQENL